GEFAADLARGGGHLGAGPLGGVDGLAGGGEERLTGGGEPDAAAGAVEQLGAQLALQPGDLVTQRGLDDPALLGRAGVVARLGDGDDIAHLLELHGSIVIHDRSYDKHVLDSLIVDPRSWTHDIQTATFPRAAPAHVGRDRAGGLGQLLRPAAPRPHRPGAAARALAGGADRDGRAGRVRAGADPAGAARRPDGAAAARRGALRGDRAVPAGVGRRAQRHSAPGQHRADRADLGRRAGRGAVRGHAGRPGGARPGGRHGDDRADARPAARPYRLRSAGGPGRLADRLLGERRADGADGRAAAHLPAPPRRGRRAAVVRRAAPLDAGDVPVRAAAAVAGRDRGAEHGLVQRAVDLAHVPAGRAVRLVGVGHRPGRPDRRRRGGDRHGGGTAGRPGARPGGERRRDDPAGGVLAGARRGGELAVLAARRRARPGPGASGRAQQQPERHLRAPARGPQPDQLRLHDRVLRRRRGGLRAHVGDLGARRLGRRVSPGRRPLGRRRRPVGPGTRHVRPHDPEDPGPPGARRISHPTLKETAMSRTVLITGATGTVSTALMNALAGTGVALRALVRDESRAPQGAEIRVGDLDGPKTLPPGFEGVQDLWLLTPNSPRAPENSMNALWAARRAGVERVVRLSVIGAAPDAPNRSGRLHALSDQELEHSGLRWTILRPHWFMQNLLNEADDIAATGTFSLNMDTARIGMIDVHDI